MLYVLLSESDTRGAVLQSGILLDRKGKWAQDGLKGHSVLRDTTMGPTTWIR